MRKVNNMVLYYQRGIDKLWLLSDGDLVSIESDRRIPQSQIDFTQLERIGGININKVELSEEQIINHIKTSKKWIYDKLIKRNEIYCPNCGTKMDL